MKNRRRRRVSDFRPDQLHNIPIPWYEAEDYPRILEILNYPKGMTRSYERWREVTENRERDLKRSRRLPVRVVITPDKFLAWCAARAIEPSYGALDTMVAEAVWPFMSK
jgi:hypothetical protein